MFVYFLVFLVTVSSVVSTNAVVGSLERFQSDILC